MPDFRFTGDEERVFPTLGLDVHPGDVVTHDGDLDAAFFAPASAPVPDPAPPTETSQIPDPATTQEP